MGRKVIRAALCAVAVAAVCAFASPALAAGGDVVVSQLYGGGGNSGAPFTNDYIELFNRSVAPVDLTGWSVQYTSATGTGTFGGATNLITPLAGTLQPGRYLLVQEAAGTNGVPLPPADVTDSTPINMSATGGKVALVHSIACLGCNGGSTPCSAAQLALIGDLVGYDGANFFEGAAPAPTLSNTTAGLRAGGGCQDTDQNGADFSAGAPAPRNSLTPIHFCGSVTVESTSPAAGAIGVDPGTAISITFSRDEAVSDGWYAIACSASGSHAAAVSGGPRTFTLTPAAPFSASETCTVTIVNAHLSDPMDADYSFSFTIAAPPVRIHDIQGASHTSPLNGQSVNGVPGIVTQKLSNGFFLQDPNPDADPATSEGIFVFGSISAGLVQVGDSVTVNGRVQEFFGSGSAATTNLSTTELTSPFVTILSRGNVLPAPTVWSPPTQVIEDDGLTVFDPASDGIDYAESLEGMRVEIDDPTATGPSVNFTSSQTTEISLVNAAAGVRTPRGGIVIQADDFNPERLILQGVLGTLPDVNVGDHVSGSVVGELDYNFGNYKLRPESPPAFVSGGLQKEVTAPAGTDQLSVATFNVENLAPQDGPDKFSRLAHVLVDNMGAPDIVALEEVQDNSGAVDDGTVNSDTTLDTLVAAVDAAGGPHYSYRYISPVNDQDGGQPGGNIRVAYFFRSDRGLQFVDRPGADSTTANAVVGSGADTHLQYSPGRIDPASAAWTSSRKPLAAEFTYNGHRLFAIANHFISKSGDQPLYGRFQPPARSSEVERHQQAQEVHDFVSGLLAADPTANVVVLGDLNDFQFSDTMSILESGGLHDLVKTLPVGEQYTYDFDGNSQAIDHILTSGNLFDRAPYGYDVVHVNSEFAAQSSDHDPQVVRVLMARPTISAARAPAANAAGWNNGPVTVTFTCVDPLSALVSCPAPVTVSAEGQGQSVTGTAQLQGGGSISATVGGISIDLTAPVVSWTGNAGTYGVDQVVAIHCSATDALSGVASSTCADVAGPAYSFGLGPHTYSATALDNAGNTGSGSTSFTVTVTSSSLCSLVGSFAKNAGEANSLCVKLDHGQIAAFDHEVDAQTGKAFTTEQAALLESLAAAL